MTSPDVLDPVLAELAARIRAALERAGLPDAEAALERPRQADHGDWATTAPLRLAKPAGRSPREIAQALVDHLDVPDAVAAVEVAGPGFVNFRLAHGYFEDLVRRIVVAGDRFGHRQLPDGERELVNLEFVSANPTGPLHVGNGRWAATGDTIAALIEARGHAVHREYYVNDAGEQVRTLGETVALVARGEPLTDKHYQGDYVGELVDDLAAHHGRDVFDTAVTAEPADLRDADGVHEEGGDADPRVDPAVSAAVGDVAQRAMRDRIAAMLHQLGVDFDTWFSESSLHRSGAIDNVIADLASAGRTYEQDGARFLRTSDFGDDKDRVIVRSDGRPTYFAADCAYLADKWSRGHTRLILLLGADHHGYRDRLLALASCLDIPRDRVEVLIGQLVTVLRGGQPVRLSKRAGEMVTLDVVVAEVGVDVARYHFLRYSLDSPIDFDLATVAAQSMDNPVYYVQYAHARIASLVRTADERGFDHGALADAELSRLTAPAEQQLLRALAQLPEVVSEAADLRATQRLTRYVEELASAFHRFYTDCRVLPGADGSVEPALGRARYWLAVAARQVLANALAILRVSAPDRM